MLDPKETGSTEHKGEGLLRVISCFPFCKKSGYAVASLNLKKKIGKKNPPYISFSCTAHCRALRATNIKATGTFISSGLKVQDALTACVPAAGAGQGRQGCSDIPQPFQGGRRTNCLILPSGQTCILPAQDLTNGALSECRARRLPLE